MLSALLGFITAILSISVDISYEYINHCEFLVLIVDNIFKILDRAILYDHAIKYDTIVGFTSWITFIMFFATLSALICRYISKQAIGSGLNFWCCLALIDGFRYS